MSPDTVLYETYQHQASKYMDDGNFPSAITIYQAALEHASSDAEMARDMQMLSICFSLNGQPTQSVEASDQAMNLIRGDYLLEGTIQRDAGMAYLRQAAKLGNNEKVQRIVLIGRAEYLFNESLARITQAKPFDETEYVTTLGFMGRAFLLKKNRKQAAQLMHYADEVLHEGDNRHYELNNLMWLIRAVGWRERKTHERRILRLIHATTQIRRYDELRLIMLGGDRLYRFIERNPRIIELVKRLRGK